MSGYMFHHCVADNTDYMQTYKKRMLGETAAPIKLVFSEIPELPNIRKVTKAGAEENQLVSLYQYFTDNHSLELSVKAEEKLEELKDILHYTSVMNMDTEIHLVKDGYVIATILQDERDKNYIWGIHYYSYAKLIRTEIYTTRNTYTNYYVTAKSPNGLYAKLVRRAFYNSDGSVAYDQIFEGEEERFLFPDGRCYTKSQFMTEFVRKLNLSSQDIVLLDSSVPEAFKQAVFAFGKASRIVALAHAGLGQKANENACYEWFPYSEILDTVVVSSEEQKKLLAEELERYHCSVPKIKVAPIDGPGKAGDRRGSARISEIVPKEPNKNESFF